MQVTIYYCRLCKLRKPAEAIAQALQHELGVQANLAEGFWGTFRIEVDGQDVFNRWQSRGIWGRLGFGRTPSPEEIVALLRNGQDEAKATADAPATLSEQGAE